MIARLSLFLVLLTGCAPEPDAPPAPLAPADTVHVASPLAADSVEADTLVADTTWTIGIVDQQRDRQSAAVLTEIRTGSHDGFERIVFAFDGPVPGYHVEYVDKPQYHCGSGEAMYLDGDAWLEIRLTPAAAHTEAGEATITERERTFDGPLLREAASTCDFEGHVTWVFGLARPNAFRVTELASPSRLVVDLQR